MMKWLNELLSRKEPVSKSDTTDVKRVSIYHDYGLDMLKSGLASGDYGSSIKRYRNVTLVNVSQCKDRVSVFGLVSAWRGTGHSEWEYLLAGMFIMSLLEAINKHEEEADITCLFNRDLTASGGKVFPQEEIYNHLIDWFGIVADTGDELKLYLKLY